MPAETLRCPSCGAAVSSAATCCDFCKATLATVTCPTCFGVMFAGAKFCSHCGAKADRQEVAEAAQEICPRCKVGMNAVVIGGSSLHECPQCEGIWADDETLRQICADREKQAAVLGMAAALPEAEQDVETNIHYVPCPICRQLMNRVNFAHCSHVVVNVCAQHGTWFDRDELRRIVEFIRAGGLDQARAREIANLEEDRRLAEAAKFGTGPSLIEPSRRDGWDIGLSAAADVLLAFFRH